ncbi:hypothetical protein F5878DRAFT_611702 [Lentinula raphanica]|uniref:Uncharacterized protein n=1 Tax=Lentinula raphanica TaxID=153919 RepID=A0AA38PE07_9AGAR|nr:hypothetical protein F5878DRAFT_611702 [Lentinula raphanica]
MSYPPPSSSNAMHTRYQPYDRPSPSVRHSSTLHRNAPPYRTQAPGLQCAQPMRRSSIQEIQKPPGEVGRPGRGGYNLRNVLGWSKREYDDVKDFIRGLVLCLDCNIPFTKQPLQDINFIRTQAVMQYGFLARYQHHWVVDDFVRCRLKYEKNLKKTRNQRAERGSSSG